MDRTTYHPLLVISALLAGVAAIAVAFSGDPQGDLGLFFSTGAEAAPIFVIALLAFLALDRPRLRPFVAVLTVLVVLGLALISWFFSLAPWLSLMDVEEPLFQRYAQTCKENDIWGVFSLMERNPNKNQMPYNTAVILTTRASSP